MATKLSQESLQSRLSFFHPGKLFSSDRDDSSDREDYLETGLKTKPKRQRKTLFALDKRNQRQHKASFHLLKQTQRQRKASY